MLRAFLLSVGLSVVAASAWAGDIETCRDNQAEAAARLAACNAVIADDKVTGKPKAYATWYFGDTLLKKRDHEGALAAFNKALELDPDNAVVLNSRGLAYSNKGDDDRALADYDLALQKRAAINASYRERLEHVSGIHCPGLPANTLPNHSYFPILVQANYPISRDALYQKLRDAGIHARRYFYPLISDFPMYRNMPSAARANLPVAAAMAEQVICLPMYPDLLLQQVERIVDVIAHG